MVLADARRIPLRDGCVQCVVTSPPYFGLRDYGTAKWEGGDPACDHIGPPRSSTIISGSAANKTGPNQTEQFGSQFRGNCGKCGAIRHDSQIGLEPSPDAYVASMVAVFRELRRVLADDAVCWLNLGDSYAGSWGAQSQPGGKLSARQVEAAPKRTHTGSMARFRAGNPDKNGGVSNRDGIGSVIGLKPKDLIGIPWRVAFALQADGWYLRSDIIWSKPNPMPESVTDRPTKSHEYMFLLTKSERYFYDADAVRERLADTTLRDKREGRNMWQNGGGSLESLSGDSGNDFGTMRYPIDGNRNARSVWSIATTPYHGAHFATMPEKLAERCILAGSRPGDLVFDPFGGSGTTVRVARRFNRRGVMLDLNPAYLQLAEERTSELQPMLLELGEETA